jgi:NAD-dependent protein deacetylase/lipoamidase
MRRSAIAAAEPNAGHDATRCSRCTYGRHDRTRIDSTSLETLPRCPECNGLLPPGVVWFGESLDAGVLNRLFEHAVQAEVCVVVGTSAVVHPAAAIPMATVESGGVLIEVNIEDTPLSEHASFSLRGASGEILPYLLP